MPVKGIVNKLVPVIEVFLKTILPAEALLVPVIPLILVLPANTVPVSAPVPSIPAWIWVVIDPEATILVTVAYLLAEFTVAPAPGPVRVSVWASPFPSVPTISKVLPLLSALEYTVIMTFLWKFLVN